MDMRTSKEIEAIRLLAEARGLDAAEMLADPNCDLCEAGRRISFVASVRAAMRPRIESSIRS